MIFSEILEKVWFKECHISPIVIISYVRYFTSTFENGKMSLYEFHFHHIFPSSNFDFVTFWGVIFSLWFVIFLNLYNKPCILCIRKQNSMGNIWEPFLPRIAWKALISWFGRGLVMGNLLDNNALCNDPLYSAIWNWRGPERVCVLLWKIGVNALLTNENKCSCHLTLDAACWRCGADSENNDHGFRHCPIIRAIWYLILPHSLHSNFFL